MNFTLVTLDHTDNLEMRYEFEDATYTVLQGGVLQVHDSDGLVTLYSPSKWLYLVDENAEVEVDVQVL